MENAPPDPALYARAPVMTIEGGIALCRVLADACPKSMASNVKKSAKKLEGVADAAQAAYATKKRALGKASDEDPRAVDTAGDNSWSALRGRLLSYSQLPVAKYPDAKRATELVVSLFGPEGLSFLTETYPVQWSVADTTLKRIEAEGLQKDIDRIAGKDFLENVRAQHIAYGTMVKGILQREEALAADLGDHVRRMGALIVEYATKVLATLESDDPDTLPPVRTALRPIDAYREAAARRAQGGGGTGEGTNLEEPQTV